MQGHLFHPKASYVKALDFTDCEDLTIKADGATLLLEGWYEVISLTRTKHITIEGLSIQYKRSPNTVGKSSTLLILVLTLLSTLKNIII